MRPRIVIVAVAAALASVAGCGSHVPAPSASQRIAVTSTAFTEGGSVPRRYTCDGEDVSPPLSFAGVPANAAELVVLLEDPDAPNGTFTHWLLWGVPPHDTRLTAGSTPRGATEGRNGFKKIGYGGPCPPRGAEPHHYVLSVYATDQRLALATDASPDAVRHALTGHILASGTLTGRYGR
ncbi:YbhB/YbcL family Raf kinase inhibitor-like protein [Streptomyces sp. MBT65]|uniref:YbhB/YbcL family Raf kinase inhibitor-like protein n=1 Tax=Streptomyces sp. MBT65 TaxID=1488395 RepID=UPI00190A0EB4|nr:YbhB/YbcL family Raf kinase inhibitor-like protein [Streptomyces sp. MBT65]MBK3579953.1 YbhB/YbcL family Raf kinase inhibitor-like protein [Streptomyces sp. MBT65]